jgi:hypothetical protein
MSVYTRMQGSVQLIYIIIKPVSDDLAVYTEECEGHNTLLVFSCLLNAEIKLLESFPKIVSFKKKDIFFKKKGSYIKWTLYYYQNFTMLRQLFL